MQERSAEVLIASNAPKMSVHGFLVFTFVDLIANLLSSSISSLTFQPRASHLRVGNELEPLGNLICMFYVPVHQSSNQ